MGQSTLIIARQQPGQNIEDALTPLQKLKNEKKIDLSSRKWDQYNLDDSCKYIQEWKVDFLLLNKNFRPVMIFQIMNINFSRIKYLSLAENRIESMQPLSCIKMPSLENLVLSKNQVINMDTIRKCKCPKLRYLNISFNLTPNLSKVSEMHMPDLGQLKFQDLGQKRQCEDLNWALKLQPTSLNQLTCLSAKRVNQIKTKKQISKKYPQISLRMLQTNSGFDLRNYPFFYDSL